MVNGLKKTALILAPPFWPNLPPLSLVMLSGYLRKHLIDVSVFDLNNEFFNLGDEKLQQAWKISSNKMLENIMLVLLRDRFSGVFNRYIDELSDFDCIGFSCYQSNIDTTLGIVDLLKSKNRNLKIILGGPEISRMYFKTNGAFNSRVMELGDCLVIGEGEIPFLKFVQGETIDKIISFHQQNNISDDEYAILGYSDSCSNVYPRKNTVSLLFSRGCIRKCRFCSERLLFENFRTRSISDIMHEIYFHKENGISVFVFNDSMLNADLNKLEELCDAIIEQFGKISWEAQIGVRTDMSESLLLKIKQSGCYNLFVGLEAGCAKTLKNMNKGFTPEQAKEFFRKLKNAGLFFGVSLIVGFPRETEEDSKESLQFLIDNKDIIPKIEQINPFVHYDGTDTTPQDDPRVQLGIKARTEKFINALREHKFKMTNAFLNNLVSNSVFSE